MEGNWVAECTLCNFSERHVEQDDALKSATRHAMKEHTEEQASLGINKWITHVQNRATDALGAPVPKPPDVVQPSPELTIVPTIDEARALAAPKPEGE